ncbi:tetratricopeptide repeat protein [Prochlorococcus sp. AH-716-M10]|nr:tetratricopeptide repeat protein [Prochlorococcus sp. AH-716-M10]
MKNEFLLKKLNVIGVYKAEQLVNHDITYWHLKAYRNNIKNEEKLIEINDAKGELDSFHNQELKDILDDANSSKKKTSNDSLYLKNKNPYSEFEKNTIPHLLEKYDQLIDDFDQDLKRERELKDTVKNYKKEQKVKSIEMFEEAEKFFALKDYKFAQKFFTNAIDSLEFECWSESKRLRSYSARGISYLNLKQYDNAIIDFTKAIELNPTSANLHFNRGLCNHYKEKWFIAIVDFSVAISFSKVLDPEYYYYRGLSKNGSKKYEDAIEDFKIALTNAPKNESYKYARDFALKKLEFQNKEKENNTNYSYSPAYDFIYKDVNFSEINEKKSRSSEKVKLTYRGVDFNKSENKNPKKSLNSKNLSTDNQSTNSKSNLFFKNLRQFSIICFILFCIAVPVIGIPVGVIWLFRYLSKNNMTLF